MSQYPNAKGKDAGKRFTSLNINQTYKGSKGENKSAPGNRSHGLQVLGKVSTRRLTPATLPSLKRENLGNDPSVNLVPSGSGGWGKKESNQSQKQANAASTTSAGPPKPPQVSGKQLDAPEISLRPNAGVGPSGKQMESGVKTWVQKVNPGQTSDSPYFQKEFPTLGQEGQNRDPDRKDHSEEGEQNVNPRVMVPQQMNGQKWMENASGMPTQPNIPFHGERPMFNGNQMPYPPYGFIPGPGGRMPIHPYYFAAYAASGGKMPPFDPSFMQRMPKPFVGPPSNKSERPSIVKDSDLKDLDQDKDDHGWDAAQDEVDYNAKLNFDESDESDDDNVQKKNDKDSTSKEKSAPSKEKDQQAWPPGYPNFHPQMMNWPRMQFPPGYEPPRGAPPMGPGPHGYPFPQFFMPYAMPPNMQQMQQQMQSKEKPDEQSPQAEGGDGHPPKFAPLKADRSEAERKAAAQAKLKALEEKMKEREKKKHEELKVEDLDQPHRKSESEDSTRPLPRSRNDSEASDSSRRSSSKEVPPRFQRKRSEQNELIVEDNETKRAESPQMQIMKRKESVESQKDESSGKDATRKTERVKDSKPSQESHKKHSTSLDTTEKTSRQTSKEGEKKVGRAAPLKGELKDLSETRREKEEKSSKKDYFESERPKRSEMRSGQRLGDMKLSKGSKKDSNEELSDVFYQKSSHKEKAANKPSAWGKTTPGVKERVSPVETTKSIVEIQKEEEEENRKQGYNDEVVKSSADGERVVDDRHSPDEHKFRSDNVERYRNKPAPRSDRPRYEPKGSATDRPRRTDRPERGERSDRFDRKRYDDRRPGDKFNERRNDGYRRRDDRKERDGERREFRDDRRDNRYDRRDIREDRRDARDDKKDSRDDLKDTREDKKDTSDDRKDARDDKKDTHGDRKDARDIRKDNRDDKKDTRDVRKDTRDDRKDARVDKKDNRGDRRDTRDERKDFRDDRKDYRDDRRDNRDDRPYRDRRDRTSRKDYEKFGRDRKPEKGDDVKEESKTESQKPRKFDKPEGDGRENKRFADKREDRRPSNRDRDRKYEQDRRPRDTRGDFRSDRRRTDDRSDNRTTKPTDSKEDVKKTSSVEKSAPTDTKEALEKTVPAEDKVPSDSQEAKQAPSVTDTTKEETKKEPTSESKTETDADSKKEDTETTKGSETTAGGFGLPPETKSDQHKTEKHEHRKTERRSNYDQRRSNYDRDNRYEGRDYSERGRGGRGGRRGTGDRYARSGRDYSKDLEDISSGELSETDEDKRKDKTHKKTRPTNWEDTPPRFRGRGRGESSGRGRGESSGRGRGESSGRGRGESSGRGRGESSGRGRGESSGRGRGEGRGRGRGQSTRGARGGRGGGRGSSASVSEQHRGTPPGDKEDSSKHDEESERFYSAEESPNSSEEKDDKDEQHKQSQERKPRLSSSGREKRSSLAYKRRGNDRPSRGARNGPFLANRQQVGDKEKMRKSGDDNALPAADPSSSIRTSNGRPTVGGTSTLEEISMHSPPKKIKTLTEKREEKKRDISREFDLNNIASVVCIDYIMPSAQDQQSEKMSAEDDGFVMVTSKKHQREQRDRAREEEKKKQKKEAVLTANKQQKERAANNGRKDSSKDHAAQSKGGKAADQTPTTSADTSTTIPTTVSTSTTISTTTVSSVNSAPASNAAMAAIGGWEPAQSLMRTSQQQAPEASKPIVTNVNAWERPLTLTAVTSSAPDPRAVGTGKPSSSQLTSMKANVVPPPPPQPTPESASPLVTPPALTPIGTTSTSLVTQVPLKGTSPDKPVKSAEPSTKPKEENTKSSTSKPPAATKKESDERSDKRRSEKVDAKKDNKQSSSKRSTRDRERPPRFQTGGKKEGEREPRGSSKYDKYEDKKYNRDKDRDRRDNRDDNKSRKRTADRQRKSDSSKSGESSKPSSKPSTSVADKRPASVAETSTVASDAVFTTTATTTEILSQTTTKSVLSDADKVVGSKKPSLKSQSSFGSYTAPSGESTTADEDVAEIQLQAETFQEPFVLSQTSLQEEDERNANQTARSVIKSLSEEEERSRETRSLPGTPPLVVKIPEPTLSGPSSDPGRAPSPTATSAKGQVPNIDHEMNEMNRRLYNTRKVWENITWSEPPSSSTEAQVATAPPIGTTPSTSNANSAAASVMTAEPPGSPTKSLPDTTPVVSTIADPIKTTEEKPSVAPGFANVPKRSEQQICKVKPQQQQPVHTDDVIRLNQTKTSVDRNTNVQSPLSASKYTSYMLPNRTLYASTENAYTEPFRSPNSQFASLSNQVRSTPHSVSTMSQQQRDLMLSSLQVGNIGNIYGSSGLQPTTNQVLTWQMVPSSSMQQQTQQPQQPKTVTYPVPNHASLFTTQSLTSNQLIMPYDHAFDPQRPSNNLQRQSINLMHLSQQQQQQTPQHTNQTSGIVGMIPTTAHTTGRPLRREQLYRSDMQNDQNINMAALLLNQSTALQQQQQLAAAQQQAQNTDLTKHVNAKPFEPTTQGPPLIQSPPVLQQSLPMAQQQQLTMSTIFRPTQPTNLGSATPRHQVQGMSHQTLLPTQRQNIQPSIPHHSSPLIASVRPRPVQPINPNALTRSQLSGDRIATIPMQYPKGNVPNIGQTSRRQGMAGHVTTNLPLSSQSLPNHYMHTAGMQQRNNARNVGVPTVPGPIQRPSQTNQIHHVNYASMPPPQSQIQPPTVGDSGDFKKIQRQKMLEDTKKYFQQQEQQQSIPPTVPSEQDKMEEKPLSNGPAVIGDKKITYPDMDADKKEGSKKVPPKNLNGDRNNRNIKRQTPSGGDLKKKRESSAPQQQSNRRNLPSKV